MGGVLTWVAYYSCYLFVIIGIFVIIVILLLLLSIAIIWHGMLLLLFKYCPDKNEKNVPKSSKMFQVRRT